MFDDVFNPAPASRSRPPSHFSLPTISADVDVEECSELGWPYLHDSIDGRTYRVRPLSADSADSDDDDSMYAMVNSLDKAKEIFEENERKARMVKRWAQDVNDNVLEDHNSWIIFDVSDYSSDSDATSSSDIEDHTDSEGGETEPGTSSESTQSLASIFETDDETSTVETQEVSALDQVSDLTK